MAEVQSPRRHARTAATAARRVFGLPGVAFVDPGVRSALDASARSAESPAGRHLTCPVGRAGPRRSRRIPGTPSCRAPDRGGSPMPDVVFTVDQARSMRDQAVPGPQPVAPRHPARRHRQARAVDPGGVPRVDRRPDRQQRLRQRRPRRRPVRCAHVVRARSTSRAPNRATCSSSTSSISGRCPRRSATHPARAGATPESSPRPTAAASSPTTSPTPTRRSGTSPARSARPGTSPASSSPASPIPGCSAPRRRPNCWPAGTPASGP